MPRGVVEMPVCRLQHPYMPSSRDWYDATDGPPRAANHWWRSYRGVLCHDRASVALGLRGPIGTTATIRVSKRRFKDAQPFSFRLADPDEISKGVYYCRGHRAQGGQIAGCMFSTAEKALRPLLPEDGSPARLWVRAQVTGNGGG